MSGGEIPILGQGRKVQPVEQLSALLDVLIDTLNAARVAAEKTLPGSELAKALTRASTLKEEITPVLAGALEQVKAGERRRNREAVVALILEKAGAVEADLGSAAFAPGADDDNLSFNMEPENLRELASKVSEALGGEALKPAARA